MPKELTHWILAEQAMEELAAESRLKEIISSCRNAYLAGAVLPDTLFYLHRGPHSAGALNLANRFHDTGGNSFDPLIRAEERYQGKLSDPLLACLLGVISHMKVDICFHPFVYALTGTGDIGRHYRFETDMDLYFLNNGIQPSKRLLKNMMTAEVRETVINACALIFDPGSTLPRQAIEHALSLHCRIQGIYDSTFWKLTAGLLSTLIGQPYTAQRQLFYPLFGSAPYAKGLEHISEWRHPVTREQRHESLDDLAAVTVRETVRIFRKIETLGTFAAALNNCPGENLLTGLSGICAAEMYLRE
jgi:hypothetical protein